MTDWKRLTEAAIVDLTKALTMSDDPMDHLRDAQANVQDAIEALVDEQAKEREKKV